MCSVDGCSSPVLARGWCSKHYQRWWSYKDVSHQRPEVETRFWNAVKKTSTCWIWMGRRKDSYGQMRFGSSVTRAARMGAHRFSYELFYGPIPNGMFVCHSCDNPRCVRPDHLFVGTHLDNIADMVAKGRNTQGDKHYLRLAPWKVRGEQNPTHKLDNVSVLDIRRFAATGSLGATLARQFNVSPQTISRIIHRLAWKHI